jgi:hypothetical protein
VKMSCERKGLERLDPEPAMDVLELAQIGRV